VKFVGVVGVTACPEPVVASTAYDDVALAVADAFLEEVSSLPIRVRNGRGIVIVVAKASRRCLS
jgi:hypothetical protein